MGQTLPTPALRPFLPTDAELLAEIFRASIEELTVEDYDEGQRLAWMEGAEDEEAFGERLAQQLTLVGTLAASPVGFISLRDGAHIDLLYVHPSAANLGVGSALVDAVEKLATARGAAKLTVDASDNAREFFASRGYAAEQRNMVRRGDEWLGNTTMRKVLATEATGRAP